MCLLHKIHLEKKQLASSSAFFEVKLCQIKLMKCNKFKVSQIINSKRFGARLSHRLNRKFVWTDDTTQDSEETATAFTVSQSSHNSRTKL